MTILENILIALNIFLAFLVVVGDLYFYTKIKEDSSWSKLLYAGVGIIWLIRWGLYFFGVSQFDIISVGPLIVATLTLLALAVGANIRVMRYIGKSAIKSDIKSGAKWILRR